MEKKLKVCDYCNNLRVIFKNAEKGKQCLFCYNFEKAKQMPGKKAQNRKRKYRKEKTNLLEDVDRAFSMIVRLNGVISTNPKMIKCYTCDSVQNFGDMHCGHYQSRRNYNTRWLVDNCRPQCYNCNVVLKGNLTEFEKRLEEEIPGIVEKLKNLSKIPYKPGISDLRDMKANMMKELTVRMKS